MPQRERNRRRLQALVDKPQPPLLYSCVPADVVKHLPPDVVAQMTESVCTSCRARVLAHKPVFAGLRETARRLNRTVTVLCRACSMVLMEGVEHDELRIIDPVVESRIDQWDNMRN